MQLLSACRGQAGYLAGTALIVAILTPEPAKILQTMFEAGQAAAYMQLAAWELGVDSCPASIYEMGKTRQTLGFPPEYHLRIAISFGYPQDGEIMEKAPKRWTQSIKRHGSLANLVSGYPKRNFPLPCA